MRLKRLIVHGFKSFADRTEFDFDANLTGIVGPNGCGKSNVVDALKWVLGDQRAKSLRGAEMTDVIFKGAEGRSGMSSAEVRVILTDAPEPSMGPQPARQQPGGGRRDAAGTGTGIGTGIGTGTGTGTGTGRGNGIDGEHADRADGTAPNGTGTEASGAAGEGMRTASGASGGDHEPRSELSIGRRLTTDKESEYLLNEQTTRLKDVRDVLMDTGLGVGAYSVMEQGRIDAVLSANPEERRSIFEEAAGISRFKLQKRETLRKLERTEQNLARVNDLLEERSRRIRGLKIQAGKARRFQELHAQLRDLKSALAVLDARRLRIAQREQEALVQARTQELRVLEDGRRELEQQLEATEAQIQALQRALEAVQAQLHRKDSDRRSAEQRAGNHEQRAEELQRDAEDCAARAAALTQQREQRLLARDASRDRLVELEEQIIALQKALEQQRQRTAELYAETKDLVVARERAREGVMEWMRARTHTRNLAHDQEAQLRAQEARHQRLLVRTEAITLELAAADQERGSHELTITELQQHAEHVLAAERAGFAELELADRDAAAIATRAAATRERRSACTSRLDLLADMAAQMEGLGSGPRFLLERRPEGLLGTLSEILDVEVELGLALEAALGPFVQALLVDTREHAEAMLTQLQQHGKGRAIVLVREEFTADLAGLEPLDMPPGAQVLADLVRCPAEARPVLEWLLRGACLVEHLEAMPRDRADLLFVTRDGQLACGPRREGGSADAQGGLVVRRAQRHALEQEAASLASQLAEDARALESAAGRAKEQKERVRLLGVELASLREAAQVVQVQLERLAARRQELAREGQALEHEQQEVLDLRAAARAALGTHLLNVFLLERSERAAIAHEAECARTLSAAQQRHHEAQQHEQEVRVQQAACTTDREGVVAALRMHDQALHEIDRNHADQQRREQESRAAAERAAAEAGQARAEVERLREELEAIAEQREQRNDQHEAARAAREQQRALLQQADQQRQQVTEGITTARLQLAELEHGFARIEERLREETEVELLRCLGEQDGRGIETHEEHGPFVPFVPLELLGSPEAVELCECLAGPALPPARLRAEASLQALWDDPEFDPAQARNDVQVLEAQVDRLGAVNHDAVKELAQEEHDFSFLEQEVGDLTEARKSLIEALRRMEQESRTLFEATFEQARANFKMIFRKLFQGGTADMYLTSPKREEAASDGSGSGSTSSSFDALECGIEIVAKPPGKELQSINLLSGGERSLTALAILFAVFKVKPSPFCILDEVDAALDETNVERFLRVLQDFVGPTQFCIVTHHKRTMAACQVLYGITMQKKGVSSRIAVSLAEVDDLHAGNVLVGANAGAPAFAGATVSGGAAEVPGISHGAGGNGNGAGTATKSPATLATPLRQRIAGEEAIGF